MFFIENVIILNIIQTHKVITNILFFSFLFFQRKVGFYIPWPDPTIQYVKLVHQSYVDPNLNKLDYMILLIPSG